MDRGLLTQPLQAALSAVPDVYLGYLFGSLVYLPVLRAQKRAISEQLGMTAEFSGIERRLDELTGRLLRGVSDCGGDGNPAGRFCA